MPLSGGRFVVPGNRWDLLDGRQPARSPDVAVVIAHFEAQHSLDRVLLALSRQNYPLDRLDVVVADDGSSVAPDLSAAGPLRTSVVRQDDRGFRAAAARNLGARHARGDVLCFLDADTVPEPDYLQALVRLPAVCPDALVTGRRRHADFAGLPAEAGQAWVEGRAPARTGVDGAPRPAPVELSEPDWLIEHHRDTANLLDVRPDSYRHVISAVLACSRQMFDELGGFDESMTGYGGEDVELAHRAVCAGAVLAHVPTAVAWHDGPSWAQRGDVESRRREKNAETAALAARIPEPGRPDRGWTGRPDVVVRLAIDDEDDAAVVTGVRSILAGGLDGAVVLTGPSATAVRERYFPLDPRVRTHTVGAAARTLVRLTRPLRVVPSAWPALLDLVRPDNGGVGEVVLGTDDGELTVTAHGARARCDRWAAGMPDVDLMATLFGRRVVPGADYGITAVPRRPVLHHELHHLLDPR